MPENQATTPLDHERYISLESFKKDGTGVKTPVWAAALDGKLVIVTDGTSYKAKRVARNPGVRVAGCDSRGKVHGATHAAQCRIIDDAELKRRAEAALKKKYGFQFSILNLFSRLSGRIGRRAFLEVTIEK